MILMTIIIIIFYSYLKDGPNNYYNIEGHAVSHLLFTYDSLFFCKANVVECDVIPNIKPLMAFSWKPNCSPKLEHFV